VALGHGREAALGHGREAALGDGREAALGDEPSWLDRERPQWVPESDDDGEPFDDADGTDIAEDDVDDAEDADMTADGASPGAGFLAHADAGRRHPRGGCGRNMVRAGEFCMDRYEAPNRRGAHPLVMQSANDADAWCAAHDKRLCTEDEWIEACQGEEHRAYPYGNEHVDGRCTDDKPWKQVDEPILAKWPAPEAKLHAKELYQATPSGSKRKCTSSVGVRDMTGNVEEWVVRTRDHANDWPYILIGCYWSGCYGGGKPTCHSTNDAHGPEFRFYETGFRCCRDLAP
jgi:formylglycine-generating enzyme required for sulfatase activity